MKANYLASPPLCVAYALVGRMDFDFETEPLGTDDDGEPVYLRDIWPSAEEINDTVADAVRADMFEKNYANVFEGDERWKAIKVPERTATPGPTRPTSAGRRSSRAWTPSRAEREPIEGARVLAQARRLDHHRPHLAGRRDQEGQPGGPLADRARRRAPRLQLLRLAARQPRGDDARHVRQRAAAQPARRPRGRLDPAHALRRGDADLRRGDEVRGARASRSSSSPARSTDPGSSRDWAAKGTLLLGVRAVIAESYERIHRSNLIGMGVLPLQFPDGESAESLGLSGEETFTVGDLDRRRGDGGRGDRRARGGRSGRVHGTRPARHGRTSASTSAMAASSIGFFATFADPGSAVCRPGSDV